LAQRCRFFKKKKNAEKGTRSGGEEKRGVQSLIEDTSGEGIKIATTAP